MQLQRDGKYVPIRFVAIEIKVMVIYRMLLYIDPLRVIYHRLCADYITFPKICRAQDLLLALL